ncbi:hypothetical protein N7474_004388 [Penicillium riverlandense]|uniref:uncharacterized protein n=1 Tax=Penicillium riverlandense TaxID=1903569 RepID=UPI0025497F02|nr:uncharacterized protein N7474_004388 [Penicillium riverlandense]KAJ5818797.1 hypothetical protein N7474_004388 [Penicillium riverlandense]
MPLGLQDLPPEIHRIILRALSKQHEPSVRAFAGVSRTCHALARPHLYHTLKITAQDSEGLGDLVENIAQALQRNASFSYVNRLVVDGELISRESTKFDSREQGTKCIEVFADDLHGSLDHYEKLPLLIGMDHSHDEAFPPYNAWQPLADLVQRLPLLFDLIFLCPNQFPLCLLETLHRHHPECRLHISKFFLRSLNGPLTDRSEFQLATSPCLFSINTDYEDEYPTGHPEFTPDGAYHREAVMHMVSRLAPNLKEVTLFRPMGPATHDNSFLPPWEGFSQEKGSIPTKDLRHGALRYLRIHNPISIEKEEMKLWAAHTDFSVLEVLKLETCLTPDLLNYLATDVDFTCLKSLVLGGPLVDYIYPQVKCFLQKLQPLSSLTIESWNDDFVVDDIVDPHGASLIELTLASPINRPVESIMQYDLSMIAQRCCLLQYFGLTLDRTEGNSEEVALYRTLGSLPQLKWVSLTLQVSVTWDFISHDDEDHMIDPRFEDEFDQQIPDDVGSGACNGAIRTRLVNCALDQALGRAIFRAISAGKPKGSIPLEKLSIRTTDVEEFGEVGFPEPLRPVLRHLSRPLQVTQHVRDDCRDELLVEQEEPADKFPPEIPEWLQAIWRRIWPKKLTDEWWNDWHSLPLASVDVWCGMYRD